MEEFSFPTSTYRDTNQISNTHPAGEDDGSDRTNNDVAAFATSSESSTNKKGPFGQRGQRLRNKLQTQLQKEEMQKRRQQAGNALKKFGTQLQKINLAKLIDQMEHDQGLADNLEDLNARMKEECERHEIRREAEQRTLEVIQDHLEVFLQEFPYATYEEWIQDLHPENANQGRLLSDIQEIDARFYVYESDHRRLWNEAMDKLEDNAHRRVEARTQIWGKAPTTDIGCQESKERKNPIDLLSGSIEFKPFSNKKETETEVVDFALEEPAFTQEPEKALQDDNQDEQSEDLIKF